MLTQLYNGRVLTPEGWINEGSVIFNGSRIVEIKKSSNVEDGITNAIDIKGKYIVPGGIELHCHGGGGSDFMEATPEAFKTAIAAHMHHGTTAIYPTLSSSPLDTMENSAEVCTQLMDEPDSPIMGLHFEGPYFNPLKAGAQMPSVIRNPNVDEYHHLVEDFECIRRWDVAPELPGAVEMGRYLVSKGVLAAIAHTAAEYPHVKAAYEAGYSHATHFYNAMTGFHNAREFKHAGTVESIYLMEEMTVEAIADGIHVPAPLLQLIYRTKGVDRTALITDSLAVAASSSTRAFDPRVIIEDGVCKLADRSALAGSIATMDRLIRTAVSVGIPLYDACQMCSATPARIMGIYDRKGSLSRNKDADILVLDDDVNLCAVFAMGKLVDGTNKL